MTRMNSVVSTQAHVTYPDPSDVDDQDERGGSPGLIAFKPKLIPSPSPEPVMGSITKSHPRNGSRKGRGTSMGEAVLVHYMGDGRHPDISRDAATVPLPREDDEMSGGGVSASATSDDDSKSVGSEGEEEEREVMEEEEEEEEKEQVVKSNEDENTKTTVELKLPAQNVNATKESLVALATQAYNFDTNKLAPLKKEDTTDESLQKISIKHTPVGEPMEDVKTSLPSMLVDPTSAHPILEVATGIHSKSPDNLAPIQSSPVSPRGNTVTLPSLSSTLGNIKLPDTPRESAFPQSPPPPPLFPQGSPPHSPLDFRGRALPSPLPFSQHRRHSQADQHACRSGLDYSSSTVDTPSDKSTPGTSLGLSRMSIDVMDNPQIGGYQCVYPNCSAAPFQTQYLLNSHANVHSQNRPHYCPVKGCGRSEGGKGFKRKNEMIRHGLVHDSPGYVCPFCPDREHKYPRPDNLQRHVRVHHVDKDKDDPLLREVLAQRSEGPSRGRRRRGTTG